MDVRPDALLEDLRRLRKGRGVHHPSVSSRFGQELRRVCGIADPSAPPSVLRARLEQCIDDLLPDEPDARRLLKGVFRLDPDVQFDTLGERIERLGTQLFVGERTVRERADEAFDLFVRSAVAAAARVSAAGSEPGHVVEAFEVDISFVGDRPRIIEKRKIKAARDGLDITDHRFSLPQPQQADGQEHPFDIKVLRGGELRYTLRTPSGVRYGVSPPQALTEGEAHTVEVRFTLPPGQSMEPHYVVSPITAFEWISITIRFDPCKLPVNVWLVEHATHREIDVFPGDAKLLKPDAGGTVTATFRGIREGHSYGIAWSWDQFRYGGPTGVGEGL